ncbi:hypothetical protein [Burkholderia cepacia]|uniref:hypothetical protein n=1 Tax=Burkholderia cepacia TaxID=292 RepID=UPI001FC87B7C|nr:hypothetical protein [Burkholderia cepacia]
MNNPTASPHIYPTGLIHLSKRCGDFFNRLSSCCARAWHRHAPIRHTISKIGQNLPRFATMKRKKPQSSRKCCAKGMNGKNCAVVARRAERHTAGAIRPAGGGPLQTAPERAAAKRRVCYRNPVPPDVLSFTEN